MKSFITYPLELEILQTSLHQDIQATKSALYIELFKKVSLLSGSIIKCGVTITEGIEFLSMRDQMAEYNKNNKMVAFQKFETYLEEEINYQGERSLNLKANTNGLWVNAMQNVMVENKLSDSVEFIPGMINEAVPDYLIENAELKISFLSINLDDYESALTALEFLYPRLVQGGILILDNYYRKQAEYRAVNNYFAPSVAGLHNLSIKDGPHYLVKQ